MAPIIDCYWAAAGPNQQVLSYQTAPGPASCAGGGLRTAWPGSGTYGLGFRV